MRQDFDFVTMDNYRANMAENTERAVAVIEEMKRKKRDVERVLVAAVLSNGGRLVIHESDLARVVGAHLNVSRHDDDRTIVLTATP